MHFVPRLVPCPKLLGKILEAPRFLVQVSEDRLIVEMKALREVESWIETYRRTWEQRLDRLDDYLTELQSKNKLETTT